MPGLDLISFLSYIQIQVTKRDSRDKYLPGESVGLTIDVGNQEKAKVALLAVDKAISGLNAQNKLTQKQVQKRTSWTERKHVRLHDLLFWGSLCHLVIFQCQLLTFLAFG